MGVRVVPWSPDWAAASAEEARVLGQHLGPWLSGPVEHVGSTAVPGMPAKPVLDLLAPVHDLDAARAAVPVLARLGYAPGEHRPHEALWCAKDTGGERSHQLHLTQQGSALWRERLAFRDALRADDALRQEYAALKLRLAAQTDDLTAYTQGKRALVARVLAAAGIALEPPSRSPASAAACSSPSPRSPCRRPAPPSGTASSRQAAPRGCRWRARPTSTSWGC